MISEALAVLETDEERTELSDFYEKNKNSFYAVARSKLNNAQDIEDAVQEAFLRIAKKPDKFFSLENSRRVPYTNVIVRNVAIDMYNKNMDRSKKIDEGTDVESILDSDVLPEDIFLSEASCKELMQFISTLPDIQRDILTMHCMLDMPMQEIADKLNISLPSAKKRLHTAREAIRGFLTREGDQNE